MRRSMVSLCLVALVMAAVVVPANAQKFDLKGGGTNPMAIPEGGIDYGVVVDDTGNLYPFIDATTGTQLFLGDDDIQQVTWPFDFDVYNDSYVGGVDTIDINSNGSVHFDAGGPRTLWINCGDAPSDIDGQWVAALGDDLDPSAAGSAWWVVTGTDPDQVLTVAWLGVPEFGGTGSVDIQVNFFQGTNVIVTQYIENTAPGFLSDGVVGINAGDAITGTEVACASAGTMPRPVHDVEYTPLCDLTATLNEGGTLRAGDPIFVDFTVEHAKPSTVEASATAVLIDLATGARVAKTRFRGLRFEQFRRTSFGGAISNGLPSGRYSLEITLNGMSGWSQRSRQLVVIE